MRNDQRRLVGNRLALAGAILYLLEWVAILGVRVGNVPAAQGEKPTDIFATYSQHEVGIAIGAAWFSLVLLGRILFVASVRDSLRRSGAQTLLADFALAAMAASVVLEIAAYAVAAGGGQAAARGADQSTIVGIDAAANQIDLVIIAPFGMSILFASIAMFTSRLFPSWLCWLGLLVGAVGCGYGLIRAPAFVAGGTFYQATQPLGLVVLGAWIWMIASGVVLFRAAPGRSQRLSAK